MDIYQAGLYLTIFVTLPVLAAFLFLLHRYRKLVKPMIGYSKGCPHRTNKKLNVTQMGDAQNYYLCELCGIKLKESDFNV